MDLFPGDLLSLITSLIAILQIFWDIGTDPKISLGTDASAITYDETQKARSLGGEDAVRALKRARLARAACRYRELISEEEVRELTRYLRDGAVESRFEPMARKWLWLILVLVTIYFAIYSSFNGDWPWAKFRNEALPLIWGLILIQPIRLYFAARRKHIGLKQKARIELSVVNRLAKKGLARGDLRSQPILEIILPELESYPDSTEIWEGYPADLEQIRSLI